MLGTAQILSYSTTLGLAAAVPGPGMTALVARSVSGGAVTGFTMLAGLITRGLNLSFNCGIWFGCDSTHLYLTLHPDQLVSCLLSFVSRLAILAPAASGDKYRAESYLS
ncbi:hypothetical protein AZ044_002581 [Pluralibacter gergoviae]|nr:hypothetical protein AZ034_002323 [Pluralibacter gergoviae]OUF56319.1 hypothetical protein AZ044_002581 [Pluralibacter gergoviae]